MEAKDIKEFELGEHCFDQILRVNGIDYDELSNEEVIEFINDILLNNINSNSLVKEVFKICLEHLQYDCVENDSSVCEQCGNYNNYGKYKQI